MRNLVRDWLCNRHIDGLSPLGRELYRSGEERKPDNCADRRGGILDDRCRDGAGVVVGGKQITEEDEWERMRR